MRVFEDAGTGLDAVVEHFRSAVAPLVERRRRAGAVLTWRLAHELEGEGVEAMKQAGGSDALIIRMLMAPTYLGFPRLNDNPLDFTGWDVVPSLYKVIEEEFRKSD